MGEKISISSEALRRVRHEAPQTGTTKQSARPETDSRFESDFAAIFGKDDGARKSVKHPHPSTATTETPKP